MDTRMERNGVTEEQRKIQINLNWIGRRLLRRFFDPPERHVEPFVKSAQVAADVGCGSGYYTFALAKCVGPEGRVYAVDLDERAIRSVEEKANKGDYRNVETHASSAANLDFIRDGSVDFVLANGLLCSMPAHRELVVSEIKRILNPKGLAYLSLGMPPPFGHVDRAEWERILEEFKVERRGDGLRVRWALVSARARLN